MTQKQNEPIDDGGLDIDLDGAKDDCPPVTADSIKIDITHETYGQIDRYCSSDTTKELGGILLGTAVERGGIHTVEIMGHIVARYTDAEQGSITFTHRTWQYINEERERQYPSLKVVGWYHTHPGFGIFLSNYDKFLHQHFFPDPWYVAYVIDPKSQRRGFFCLGQEGFFEVPFSIGGEIFIEEKEKWEEKYAAAQQDVLALKRKLKFRHKVIVGLAALSLIAVGALSGGLYWSFFAENGHRNQYNKVKTDAHNEKKALEQQIEQLEKEITGLKKQPEPLKPQAPDTTKGPVQGTNTGGKKPPDSGKPATNQPAQPKKGNE